MGCSNSLVSICERLVALCIHLFRRSLHKNMPPRKHNSMHIAIQTPFNPIVPANHAASGMRTPHILTRFIIDGGFSLWTLPVPM